MTLINDLNEICVFDTETNGTNTEVARVVTAFTGVMNRAGELVSYKEWIINPGVPIPQGAIDVHGISNERAAAEGMDPATGIAEINAELQRNLDAGIPIAAYNARYDLTLMDRESRRYGLEPVVPNLVIDPFVIDKQVDKYRRGKRQLTITAAHYGITLEGAHDAKADSVATGKLTWVLLDRLASKGFDMEYLHTRIAFYAREQAISLQDYFRKTNPDAYVEPRWPVVPFDADVAAASEAAYKLDLAAADLGDAAAAALEDAVAAWATAQALVLERAGVKRELVSA